VTTATLRDRRARDAALLKPAKQSAKPRAKYMLYAQGSQQA